MKSRDERLRLKELQSYCVLDTSSEADFDNITTLVAKICETPIATITLIDIDREWFKSVVGLQQRENARNIAFCAKAILSNDLFIVPDALNDEDFKNNPMVIGPPYIRFYAGIPLISPNGHALGTLAVKDFRPRELNSLQILSIKTLADQVMLQLESRRQSRNLEEISLQRNRINQKLILQTKHLVKEREFLGALLENLSEGIVACDDKGKLSLFNNTTRELHGLDHEKLPPNKWSQYYDLYKADGKTLMPTDQIPLFRAYSGEKVTDEEMVIAPKNQPAKTVVCNGQPILNSDGEKLGAVVAMRDITEQKIKDLSLAKSEAKLSAIFNQSYLFQALMENDGTVLDVNDMALEACGYHRDNEIGKKFWETSWWIREQEISNYVKTMVEKGLMGEVVHASSDYHIVCGTRKRIEFVLTPIRDDCGKIAYLLASGQDVTERKKAESELARINRSLRLLSSSNELLIREKSESNLLSKLCELIVKVGGYKMAWVGYAYDDSEKSIKPIAHYGDFSHLKNIKLSWSESLDIGKGPAARTIRGGKAIVIEDILNDSRFAPWADSASKNGFKGVISLPLIHESKVFGIVAMYTSEVTKIIDSEISLLQELADDLAFGIMNTRAQEESQRFHDALYKMAASVSASIDEEFFIKITKTMTEATGADLGLIAKLLPNNKMELQCLSVINEGLEEDKFNLTLEAVPYSELINTDCFILSQGNLKFLEDVPELKKFGMKNCVGHRLTNHEGGVTGVAIVMFMSNVHNSEFVCSLLKIFAARVGAELDRLNSDRHIRDQASLLDKAQDAIMVRDLDNKVQFWNSGAERLYGWTREEAIGQSIEKLIYTDPTHFYLAKEKLMQLGEWNGEIEQKNKSNDKLIIESHWTLVNDAAGQPQAVFTINTNITDRKAAANKIHDLAFYDPLTKLPNRTLLIDRLKKALIDCENNHSYGALLFIDLDNFKALNDTLGHDMGDLLLNEIGKRLKTCIRATDCLARFGGDEFVIMLENVSNAETAATTLTKKIAENMLKMLNAPFFLDDYEHMSTASIGIALFSSRECNINQLLKRADLAMYQAKAMGRNTFRFFDPLMESEISARVLLESDLRQSLAKHQFSLHYQPQINHEGFVVGAEALLRWHHPERGMVSPVEFIPVAEETRMILPIGHWVIETACAKLVSWAMNPETSHLTLAVNVSERQFWQTDFVEKVCNIINHFGANPKKLKLELTESLFASNVEDVINKMYQLKKLGVSFSLDDFGTGYSSLSYLKKMPIDQLKIDQSFVRDILDDANEASIAQTIIKLAQSLGVEVIAEGVETEEQKQFLYDSGCKFYQGYLISRPLPSDMFEDFMKNWKTQNQLN